MPIEVMREHTKSLDANGKLIQTRSPDLTYGIQQRVGNGKSECEKLNPLYKNAPPTEKLAWIVSRELRRKKTRYTSKHKTTDTENGKNSTISEAKSVCSS